MIWIELLSRHREILTRVRITGSEAHIGRGYDNDVVVDDPYVAASHLRIFRSEDGQLIAEDMGSVNGTFLDGDRTRLSRVAVDGKLPIRIGQTLVRIRESGHLVEPERIAPAERPVLPIVVAVALSGLVLGLMALDIWLAETGEPRVFNYLTPLLTIVAAILVWTGMWVLLARIFSGRSHFLLNLVIALAGTLAVAVYVQLARYFAFAFVWPLAITYQYAALWTVVALVCFLHLRNVSTGRQWLKGAIVTTGLIIVITTLTLQRSEALSDIGRQNTVNQLMPPALRVVSAREQDAFFGDVAKLKAGLDNDRKSSKSGGDR